MLINVYYVTQLKSNNNSENTPNIMIYRAIDVITSDVTF